jgi:hypothetical protein
VDRIYVEALEERLDIVAEVAAERELEIRGLKELCRRAAEALEEEFGPLDDPAYGMKGPIHELIAQLRKAAE